MKQSWGWIFLLLFAGLVCAEESEQQKLRRLLNEASILVFDKKFEKAKSKYEGILKEHEANLEARIGLMEAPRRHGEEQRDPGIGQKQ